jgi:cobalamin biosynthesis protein CbiG
MTGPPPTGSVDLVSRELDAQLARYADRVRRAVARYGLAGRDVDEIVTLEVLIGDDRLGGTARLFEKPVGSGKWRFIREA